MASNPSPLQEVHQPIHPSMSSRLDPQYIDFHEKCVQYIPLTENVPWSPACRTAPSASAAGRSQPVSVGSIQDLRVKSKNGFGNSGNIELRIFTPEATRPNEGWPVLVWFHGGGWTMGGLASENSLLTRACRDAPCLVISVNYRHAPENPYPAAVDDALDALIWMAGAGKQQLGIDSSKLMLGGLSAGGNLTAILSLKAALLTPPIHILKQLLILPVIDNTAGSILQASNSTSLDLSAIPPTDPWFQNQHAPFLTPARMLWYRNKYLPDASKGKDWTASPNLAPTELLAKSPPTFVAVGECDLLAEEGRRFGAALIAEGVECETVEYAGGTHSMLIFDGVLDIGKKLRHDIIATLQKGFRNKL